MLKARNAKDKKKKTNLEIKKRQIKELVDVFQSEAISHRCFCIAYLCSSFLPAANNNVFRFMLFNHEIISLLVQH